MARARLRNLDRVPPGKPSASGASGARPHGSGWTGISPDEIEVGVVVHPTHWNRGIGTEAAEIVAADCFTRVGLNRLVALTTVDNKSSPRTLEKIGMRRRGVTQHEGDHTTYELFELARPARQP